MKSYRNMTSVIICMLMILSYTYHSILRKPRTLLCHLLKGVWLKWNSGCIEISSNWIRIKPRCFSLELNQNCQVVTTFLSTSIIAAYLHHPTARNLGITYDAALNMEKHVAIVCQRAYMQLHRIGMIRRYLTDDATKSLVHAFVGSRLDYGNSLLFGLPATLLKKLQRVQNVAARIITRTRYSDHITPILKSLHWLPIHRRIEFKLLLIVYHCLNNTAPSYLRDMLQTYAPTRSLRSCKKDQLIVPRSKLVRYGDRSFNIAAPHLWNSLPNYIRQSKSLEVFKKNLKTHFFSQEYDI